MLTSKEIVNIILELSSSFKDENIESQDSEIIEYSVLKMITEHILGHSLSESSHPFASNWTSDKLRYLVDSTSLVDDAILDLNWTFSKSFWVDQFESKENYLEMIHEMIQNKELYYNLEDDF